MSFILFLLILGWIRSENRPIYSSGGYRPVCGLDTDPPKESGTGHQE